jgi:hypothetical protein
VTVAYWIAAAAALISAVEAVWEFARDRLPALAAWTLSMTALSASLAVAAADPAVVGGGSGPAVWACAGLGILGTWAFASVLSMGQGDARSVTRILATPFLAGVWAALLLAGLNWAGSRSEADAEFARVGTQLTLLAYFVPSLCQIAFLAWQRAILTPPSWARTAMRAVAASAIAELALTVARSAMLIGHASGMGVGESAITVIGILQGIAVIWGIGALAVGPAVILISARSWPLLGYGRRRPPWVLCRRPSDQPADGHEEDNVAITERDRTR